MKYKAGTRIKAVRGLMGFTVDQFADLLGIKAIRLKNVELLRAKVSEEEYEEIGGRFPEVIPWLTYEGPLDLEALRNSQSEIMRLVAAKIEARQFPKGMDLSEFVELP